MLAADLSLGLEKLINLRKVNTSMHAAESIITKKKTNNTLGEGEREEKSELKVRSTGI